MKKLIFTSVTAENSTIFHSLMQMYAKELDEHQGRDTAPQILKRLTDSIIQKQHSKGRCLKLVCYDNEIVGFLYGKIDLPEDNGFKKIGYGYIMEFYVLPEQRRKGYGREMLQYLEKHFRSEGTTRSYLTADPVTGKPFWEAAGFVGTGEISPENKLEIYEKNLTG